MHSAKDYQSHAQLFKNGELEVISKGVSPCTEDAKSNMPNTH